MEEITFMEFVQAIGAALTAAPATITRLLFMPKTAIGWMMTLLIVTCIVGCALGIALSL